MFYFYLRLINVTEMTPMLVRSDIKKATIQYALDAPSVVSTFRRLSVQKKVFSSNYNKNIFIRFKLIKLHILPYLPSQKQFPLNLSHVWLMHCPLQGYWQFSPKEWVHSKWYIVLIIIECCIKLMEFSI